MTPYLLLSAALFCVGVFGVIARRNILIVLMSLELMLNGANIALIAFARQHAVASATAPTGHVFVLIVMAVAAAEVAVGLAIVISLWRTRRTVDTNDLQMLNG